MNRSGLLRFVLASCVAAGLSFFGGLSAIAQEATAAAEAPSFQKDIQPILAKHCYACHGPDDAEAGLRLDSREGAYAETESGSFAIVPGDVELSVLVDRITSDDEYERMPPEGDRVPAEEVELIRRWIAAGAEWESHWAFDPVQHAAPPEVSGRSWSDHPIDAFILSRLRESGLEPNPAADRRTLVRRAYYDLWGLPPTETQVQAFLSDESPDAWPRLIDSLLESHHYGEKWGRHWLDLVRYAETNSFERDNPKPNAWKYRDYVIRAFNDDKPYDDFIREQLAGDELDEVTTESLTATGFYRLGIWDDEPADPLQARYDELDDLMTTTGQAFLGLTINCARCHDHKIDPIPQADYYSMLAFFADVTPYGTRGDQRGNNQIEVSPQSVQDAYAKVDRESGEVDAKMREIEQEGIAKMPAPDQRATEGPRKERQKVLDEKLQAHLSAERWAEYEQLVARRKALNQERRDLPAREYVMGLGRCDATPDATKILVRGNPHVPGDEVGPRFPELFGGEVPELEAADADAKTAGRRLALAEWIASKDNMLTSRVMANRVWQFHFGRGIVRSTNNFGQLGTPPTHPLLLDYLANQLVDGDWSLKSLHRLIMTSQAYQMSSQATSAGLSKDPNNDLFWRFDPRRLSAEEVRDSLLVVTDSLNSAAYGPSFYPKVSAEVLAGQSRPGAGWGNSSEEDRNRRSVYIHVKRSLLTPMLTAFDFPDPDRTCEARFTTLQPGQALALMNSDYIDEQAEQLAERIIEQVGDDPETQVGQAIRFALARAASEEELESGVKLMREIREDYGLPARDSLKLYCLTVFNWNEFMFID